MAEVKLTKNELRAQQVRLNQLEKYLPTLQLKKAMLQTEVNEVRGEILRLENAFHEARLTATHSGGLLNERVGLDLTHAAKVERVEKEYENIAGVDIPLFKGITFAIFEYPLFSTPAWLDASVAELRQMAIARAKVSIAEEKKTALEKELREVSIRVNLFEKNLIPRARHNIKRIRVFLGDQELAAVGQAKVAKAKIEQRKHAN
ncbi:MAG: V-type ATP synthase subunit D [Chlamydiales bacterium]|nr:V-type ATP synthase subunit D [Chlamydiales bacterium]